MCQVKAVLKAAFSKYPRLGAFEGESSVRLKSWTETKDNQVMYHNEAMKCCRVSIREISRKRAQWSTKSPLALDNEPEQGHELPAGPQLRVPQPATPPGGRDPQ